MSIKITVAFWIFFTGLATLGLLGTLLAGDIKPAPVAWSIVTICGLAYQSYAASRLSRWSLLTHTLLYAGVTLRRYLADPNWTDRYPILGVFTDIIPWGFVTILIAVHWRKMNWAPLGLPYRPPSPLATPQEAEDGPR